MDRIYAVDEGLERRARLQYWTKVEGVDEERPRNEEAGEEGLYPEQCVTRQPGSQAANLRPLKDRPNRHLSLNAQP